MNYRELLAILPDASLEITESDQESSRYIWGCGCIAIRPADADVCQVLWCTAHRKERVN